MLRVDVSLPSGCCVSLSLSPDSTVEDLKIMAQKCFGQGFLRLVTAKGKALTNLTQSLLTAGIQEGEHLTAIAQQARLSATEDAFAVWCCGGDRIVTWGDPDHGGDSSAVQDQLKNVQQVHAARFAFAAILADGSVVTWGDPIFGGDSSAVQDQLKTVQHIQATGCAFAAIH